MPDRIIAVAELEPYGLTKRSMELLDDMNVVWLSDMETISARDIRCHVNGGPSAIHNIRETLTNYLKGNVVRSFRQMIYPERTKRKKK